MGDTVGVRTVEALVDAFSGDAGPLLKGTVIVNRNGLRLVAGTPADLTSATVSSSELLDRLAREMFACPVGPPHEHYIKLIRTDLGAKIDAAAQPGQLCWAILTTGYATRPLRTSGPGRPDPAPAAAGVGANLVLMDAVSGAPYGNQIEWATRATPGEAQ